MSDRCRGHCCRHFTLPFSPEELQENYRAWRNGEEKDANGRESMSDIFLIAPMVRHLGLRTRNPLAILDQEHEPRHYYSCKHLEPNGDCGIYAARPQMCREYPYGKACSYKGCSWDAVKRDLAPEMMKQAPESPAQ